jgi:hypothetical protein
MALSNEGLVPHLQELHPNLVVINPWEIVTPDIVQALKAPASSVVTSAAALPPHRVHRHQWRRASVVLMALATAFAILLAAATVFVHYSEQVDWLTAMYFRGQHGDDDGVRRHQPAHVQRCREDPRYQKGIPSREP